MAGEKFYLKFISDGFGEVQIDEPIGYTALSWDFKQKEKGYARDILFNGGEAQMEFTDYRNHYVDKLFEYYHFYGFESQVELTIEFTTGLKVTYELDFLKAQTDEYKYFRCKMIQKSDILLAKRKADTKVDLFSNKDIYGNAITPVASSKILIKPKSIIQRSKWQQVEFKNKGITSKSDTANMQANPCQIIVQDDIKDTLTSIHVAQPTKVPSDFYIIEAQNTMINTRILIKQGMHIDISTDSDGAGKGYCDFNLSIIWGKEEKTGTKITLLSTHLDCDKNQSFVFDTPPYAIDIPLLERGDKVWLYFTWKVKRTNDVGGGKVETSTTITGMEVEATATTSTYYSVASGVRLIDAIKQIIASTAGKNIDAPIFSQGKLYYDTFLLNGNLLRGAKDKPFFVSLTDITKCITECNSDYEVGNVVFFGHENDYYTPNECGFFDTVQFERFSKTFNERMAINQFIFKYKNFQAQKENELPQTSDTVHGSSELTLVNKRVENKKEVEIEWARDGFLIEEARGKALVLTDETSYQDDDTLFAVDTVVQLTDAKYREAAELNHEYNITTGHLNLKSASVNFILMGIEAGTKFTVLAPDKNAGEYNVISVTNNTVELQPSTSKPNTNNDGVRKTAFEYTIKASSVPLKNYTTENITNAFGINDPASCSNLRFSVKRNIQNYYSEYLATCNSYWKTQPIKTTEYKNNRDFGCTINGVATIEGGDFLPTKRILSTNMYEDVIFANVSLEEFFTLINNLRTKRGFIRTIDKNRNVIKLYPKNMTYKIPNRELSMMAEEKFEPSQMTISTANTEITINNETAVHQLTYEINDKKLYLFDTHRQLLYNGVYWDKVAINGQYAKDFAEFQDLMELIKSKNN